MGVMPAQNLAQNRAGARGAVFFESSVPAEEFGGPWPAAVPLQIHAMDADPEFIDSGDVDAARELVAAADDGELFLYPGDQHLFTRRRASRRTTPAATDARDDARAGVPGAGLAALCPWQLLAAVGEDPAPGSRDPCCR